LRSGTLPADLCLIGTATLIQDASAVYIVDWTFMSERDLTRRVKDAREYRLSFVVRDRQFYGKLFRWNGFIDDLIAAEVLVLRSLLPPHEWAQAVALSITHRPSLTSL